MKILIAFLLLLSACQKVELKKLENTFISVEIRGAVSKPGVYEILKGSLLEDLLDKCEGVLADAMMDGYSLSMPLYHHDFIEILRKEDVRVSINQANEQELATIKGIGIKTAQAIIDYRQKKGQFKRLEELMQIRGIKQKKFDAIKEYLKL